MAKHGAPRTVLAGLAGGAAVNIAMLATFRLIGFGWEGKGILLDPTVQSKKLIAVWTALEPPPLVVSNPAPIAAGLFFFAIGHAFIYRCIAAAWPAGFAPRAWRLAALIFFMTFLFWEFFTPFNQFGEPLPLVALELLFWAVCAAAEAVAVAAVMEIARGGPTRG